MNTTESIEIAPVCYSPIEKDGKYVDFTLSSASGVYCPCKPATKIVIYHGKSALSSHFKTKGHQKWLEEFNLLNSNTPLVCKECISKDTAIRDLKIQITNLQNKLVDYELKEKRIRDLVNLVNELKFSLKKEKITVSALQTQLANSTHYNENNGEEYSSEDNEETASTNWEEVD